MPDAATFDVIIKSQAKLELYYLYFYRESIRVVLSYDVTETISEPKWA